MRLKVCVQMHTSLLTYELCLHFGLMGARLGLRTCLSCGFPRLRGVHGCEGYLVALTFTRMAFLPRNLYPLGHFPDGRGLDALPKRTNAAITLAGGLSPRMSVTRIPSLVANPLRREGGFAALVGRLPS